MYRAGVNVGMGTDHTLFATAHGVVEFRVKGAEAAHLRQRRFQIDKPRALALAVARDKRGTGQHLAPFLIYAVSPSMKFIDEAKLKVQAGNGGRGCVSFRREKFVPFGGPDGGDGGLGGSVYLKAVEGMNTLADFRISRTYKGQNGEGGSGNDCTGHGGDDMYVPVPVGTVVSDLETGEQLGDLMREGQILLVAKGGKGGWGNTRFKSSTNRTPRKAGLGLPGEKRELALELKLIADVGLARSAERRQVHFDPRGIGRTAQGGRLSVHHLASESRRGDARVPAAASSWRTFPGLIEGAADGAGLGIRFLEAFAAHADAAASHRHRAAGSRKPIRSRTRAPSSRSSRNSRPISPPRSAGWLINKIDLLEPKEARAAHQGHRAAAAMEGAGIHDFRRHGRGNRRTQAGGDALSRRASAERLGRRERGQRMNYFASARTCFVRRLLCRAALLR